MRSFIKEIMNYQKLDEIGIRETEILGLKVKMEKALFSRVILNLLARATLTWKLQIQEL